MRTKIAEYVKNRNRNDRKFPICNDLDFVCITEKPGYVFFFVSVVKINQ